MTAPAIQFIRRSDLCTSLRARAEARLQKVEAFETHIRTLEHEIAVRMDPELARKSGYPAPKSKRARAEIKGLREDIKAVREKINAAWRERRALLNDLAFQESVRDGNLDRPLRDKRPIRQV